jgi:hypothetical protein
MDDDDEPRVCVACVGEAYLKAWIQRIGTPAACAYCDEDEGPTISVDELADEVEGAFERHYYRTSDQPDGFEMSMLADRELSYEWERAGEPVIWAIAGAAEVEEELATDIQELLEERHSDFEADQMGDETEFAGDSHYDFRRPDDAELQFEWRAFERSLKTESRYFNRIGMDLLAKAFAGIGAHQTRDDALVVREAGPGLAIASLYRARVFDNDADLDEALRHPDRELGPPPSRRASAGRMNAQGVSVFYGALDAGVALAEVRPPVGARVGVAKFDLSRPLRLLDLEALRALYVTGSIFDPGHLRALELARFLESVSARMTRPVMPNDEPFDYLTTQAIADYLATEIDPPLDGILFPSVQQGEGEMNVVLFHHASKVAPVDQPEGIEFRVKLWDQTEDGDEPDFWVFEHVPPPPDPPATEPSTLGDWARFDPSFFDESRDAREAALTVDLEGIEIHYVARVSFKTDVFPVKRHRTVKHPLKFGKADPEPF